MRYGNILSVEYFIVNLNFSPCQRSILYAVDLKWREFVKANSPIGSDESVDLYSLPDGILLATWKVSN